MTMMTLGPIGAQVPQNILDAFRLIVMAQQAVYPATLLLYKTCYVFVFYCE